MQMQRCGGRRYLAFDCQLHTHAFASVGQHLQRAAAVRHTTQLTTRHALPFAILPGGQQGRR